MSASQTAQEILNRDYLEIRCRVLDLAASLDRLDRARDPAAVGDDPRLRTIREAVSILLDGKSDRAERVQMTFSDAFERGWRGSFGL